MNRAIEAPPWEVALKNVATIMQSVLMYEPVTGSPAGKDAPTHLEVRRMTYVAPGDVQVHFSFLMDGTVHCTGSVPEPLVREAQRRERFSHSFAQGTLNLESLKRDFLWPLHSHLMPSKIRTSESAADLLVFHTWLQHIANEPDQYFRFVPLPDGRYAMQAGNAAAQLISARQGTYPTDYWMADAGRTITIGQAASTESTLLARVLNVSPWMPDVSIYHLITNPDWWPWFQEFSLLSAYFQRLRLLDAGSYAPNKCADRISLVAALFVRAMISGLSARMPSIPGRKDGMLVVADERDDEDDVDDHVDDDVDDDDEDYDEDDVDDDDVRAPNEQTQHGGPYT